jgi:mRNA interferase MazF
LKRGEIWTAAGGPDYAGKPRPVVIIQDNRFDFTRSITICGLTTDNPPAPLFRLLIAPNESNALHASSYLMVDKITTIPKTKIGRLIGHLNQDEVAFLNRALAVFLGFAGADTIGQSSGPF